MEGQLSTTASIMSREVLSRNQVSVLCVTRTGVMAAASRRLTCLLRVGMVLLYAVLLRVSLRGPRMQGIYGLHSMQQKVLPIVSFVFDEPPRAPTAAAAPASKAAPGAAAAPAPSGKEPETQGATAASGGGGDSPQSRGDAGLTTQHPAAPVGPIGPMGPPAGAVKREPSDNDVDGKVEAVEDDSKAEAGAGRNGDSVKKEEEEPSEAGPGPGPQPRRMAGPAMPPRELLAAAAAAAEALAAAGPGAGGLRYDDDDDDDDDGGLLVGPPPPELVMELEAAPQDEREAEVVRIMKVGVAGMERPRSAVASRASLGHCPNGCVLWEAPAAGHRLRGGQRTGNSPTELGQMRHPSAKTHTYFGSFIVCTIPLWSSHNYLGICSVCLCTAPQHTLMTPCQP